MYNRDALYFRCECEIADRTTKTLGSVRYWKRYAADAKRYSEPQIAERPGGTIEALCHLGDRVRINPHDSRTGHYFVETLLKVLDKTEWRLKDGGPVFCMN